jgi:hypothetical protein
MEQWNYFNYLHGNEEYFWKKPARTCWFPHSIGQLWRPGESGEFRWKRHSKGSIRP